MMTPRERIEAIVDFKKPDKLPWIELFEAELIFQWVRQGLPLDEIPAVTEWKMWMDGILVNEPEFRGFDPYSYFGCTNWYGLHVPVDLGPIPRFKRRVIRDTERYREVLTETGARLVQSKRAKYWKWYSMPRYVEFPVRDRETWEQYKKRLNPSDPRRYAKDWHKEAYLEAFDEYQDGPTRLGFTGFFGFGAQLMGIERFTTMFYRDPKLVHDMADYWEFFTIETLREAVETLKDKIDLTWWWEDMAEKNGPFVSPKLYTEFFLPHYRKVTKFLRKNNVNGIMVDSDGNLNAIMDLMVEAGINGLWPLEVSSGMDAIQIREKYGKKLFVAGNLDKRELVKGGDDMKREVDSKVPKLKEIGGYLPGVDHEPSADFCLPTFKEYAEYIKRQLSYNM